MTGSLGLVGTGVGGSPLQAGASAGTGRAGGEGKPGGYLGGWSLRKYVQLVSFGSLHASGAWANSG